MFTRVAWSIIFTLRINDLQMIYKQGNVRNLRSYQRLLAYGLLRHCVLGGHSRMSNELIHNSLTENIELIFHCLSFSDNGLVSVHSIIIK